MSAAEPPLVVYVVFHETNTGTADESDGWVESVWATEALADAEALRLTREARDAGLAIWADPDDPRMRAGNPAWEHDWRVDAHAVSSVPNVPGSVRAALGLPGEPGKVV